MKKVTICYDSDEYRKLFYHLVYHKTGKTPNQNGNGKSGQTGTTGKKK
jgi:hypothetical protein